MTLPLLRGSLTNKQGLTPKKNPMDELLNQENPLPSGNKSEWEKEDKFKKATANKTASPKVTKHVQFDSEVNIMMMNETASLQVSPKPLQVAQLQETKPAIFVSTSELELREMEKREQMLKTSLEEADKRCHHIPKYGRRSLKSEQDEIGDAAKHCQYERDDKHILEMQSRKKKL